MSGHSPPEVTRLLLAWCGGDQTALNQLIPLIHAELRRLAHHYMLRECADHTLQTTALVNEAYLRLVRASKVPCQDRSHFLAVSANLMRRILVDFEIRELGTGQGSEAALVAIRAGCQFPGAGSRTDPTSPVHPARAVC